MNNVVDLLEKKNKHYSRCVCSQNSVVNYYMCILVLESNPYI